MSTELTAYVLYLSNWDKASVDDITSVINEQKQFLSVGDFNADNAINSEFDELISLAKALEADTVAEDAIEMLADAAAVAAIWSFGLGMAAFLVLEAAAWAEGKVVSDKSAELNAKLTTIDTDIAVNVSPEVKAYVASYKANNNLIMAQAPKGLDPNQCRAFLMQFMAQVQRLNETGLDVAGFQRFVESASSLYNSVELQKIGDALDKLNFSDKTVDDVQACLETIQEQSLAQDLLHFVEGCAYYIMVRSLNIAREKIRAAAQRVQIGRGGNGEGGNGGDGNGQGGNAEGGNVEGGNVEGGNVEGGNVEGGNVEGGNVEGANVEVGEASSNAFKMMDAVGKFAAGVAIVTTVVDVVLDIMSINNVVTQTNNLCDKLSGDIKTYYIDYFNGIRTASQQYNAAIASTANAQALTL